MDEMIFLPSRVHEDDIPCTAIIDDHGYQHLNLPYEAGDESAIDWFQKTWANRLKTEGPAIVIVSRIYEEEGGQG